MIPFGLSCFLVPICFFDFDYTANIQLISLEANISSIKVINKDKLVCELPNELNNQHAPHRIPNGQRNSHFNALIPILAIQHIPRERKRKEWSYNSKSNHRSSVFFCYRSYIEGGKNFSSECAQEDYQIFPHRVTNLVNYCYPSCHNSMKNSDTTFIKHLTIIQCIVFCLLFGGENFCHNFSKLL